MAVLPSLGEMSPTAFTFADDTVEPYESDADLDIVKEIDKFLEGYTSDGAERQENNNYVDEFDDDPLNIFDTDNLENDHRTSINNIDVQFVGENSAVFHLLEDNEEYGIYEHIPNECNWNVFYKTLPPGEPNYSIKQEPTNGEPNYSIKQEPTNCEPNYSIKQEPTNDEPNYSIKQESTNCEPNYSIKQEPTNDDQNELENFSFLSQLNSIQNPIDSQYTEDQKLNNLDNKSKSEIRKWKQNKKFDTDFGNKLPTCEYSKTQNFRKEQRNWKNFNSSSKKKKNKFKKKLKNTFKYNPPENGTSFLAPNNINNSTFPSFFPPIHSKSVFNQPIFNELDHTATKMQDWKNTNPLPMQQNYFHTSNKQYSEMCLDNKKKVFSNSQEIKNNVNFELHHVIKDYLCPSSLVGCTIKFTSRKLANTFIRDKLNMALNSYGTVENSWWTPDDLFFTTYTSRKIAQHVFKIYPKNPTSSY